jgi:hypothetical protein
LWHHFVLSIVLGFTFIFFYSILLAGDSARPIVVVDPPDPGPPFQIVLDPPVSYNLLPIPMEGR